MRDYQPKNCGIPHTAYMAVLYLVRDYGRKRNPEHPFSHCIEIALTEIPAEYRKGVFRNIAYYKPFPDDAHPKTYSKYRAEFIKNIAKMLNLEEVKK